MMYEINQCTIAGASLLVFFFRWMGSFVSLLIVAHCKSIQILLHHLSTFLHQIHVHTVTNRILDSNFAQHVEKVTSPPRLLLLLHPTTTLAITKVHTTSIRRLQRSTKRLQERSLLRDEMRMRMHRTVLSR